MLSKVLQNLANSVEFGEKEAYMTKTNTFIMNNQTSMFEFLDKIADVSMNDAIQQMQPHVTEAALVSGMDFLAINIKRLFVKISKHLGDSSKVTFHFQLDILTYHLAFLGSSKCSCRNLQ